MRLYIIKFIALMIIAVGFAASCSDGESTHLADTGAGPDVAREDTGADVGPDAAAPREIGEACTAPDQCVQGASCIGGREPGSFECMKNCETAGRICDDGSVCTSRLAGDSPICYTAGTVARGEACETNLDCEPGTLCFGTDGEFYCLAACHELDAVCPENSYCHTGSSGGKGFCRPELGAPCGDADACRADLSCSQDLDTSLAERLTDGYCTLPDCTSDADCPGDGVCRTLPGTQTAICMQTCQLDADCRFNLDYRCLDTRYCEQVGNPEGCEAFRDGASVCLPVELTRDF